VALPVVLGRAADIDISSGSGQERIKLWSDGLTAITSPRILFGVGEGMYDQYARLVAHNSYIHAFVELGFFGGTMFFGCVFFPAVAYLRLYWTRVRLRDPELERLKPFLAAVLGCWCMGMCSLSRCYAASTYMIFGLSAAYLNLAGFYQPRPRPLVVFDWLIAQRWILCSAGLLACCFVFVRVFARFG
jgi:O-antigen ligase